MLNYIWAAIVLGGILIAGLLGNLSGENGVIPAALDMAKPPSWASHCPSLA